MNLCVSKGSYSHEM